MFVEFSQVDWCHAMLNVKHQGTQFVLDVTIYRQPVQLFQQWTCMSAGCSATDQSGSSVLHTLEMTNSGRCAAGEETITVVQSSEDQRTTRCLCPRAGEVDRCKMASVYIYQRLVITTANTNKYLDKGVRSVQKHNSFTNSQCFYGVTKHRAGRTGRTGPPQ